MQLNLAKTFPLDIDTDAAWRLLCDTPRLAECMPGAEITEQVSDTAFKGQVSVHVGPINAAFKGELEIKSCDETEKKIIMVGKGTDISGSSATSLEITAWIVPVSGDKCELSATSNIHINGKLANFGSRMFLPVSDQILKQFGSNFATRALTYSRTESTQTAVGASSPANKLDILSLIWNTLVTFAESVFGKASVKSSHETN